MNQVWSVMKTPEISIVIPIYNTAKYLRPCLESCVGQTLENIQILCVDHASTDGSRSILEEFAARDSRIQIIDCPNTGGGPGQARNAAFPHILGVYTYFADSDDWLDTQLCEKACARMDETGCDILLLDFHPVTEQGRATRQIKSVQHAFPRSGRNGIRYLDYLCAPWTRVLRTFFIKKHDLRYLEGCMPEDHYFHWIQMANDPHVEILDEKLYYYRLLEFSQIGKKGEYVARTPQIFPPIREYLEKNNCYSRFREKYIADKVNCIYNAYYSVRPEYRTLCKTLALQSLRKDEIPGLCQSKAIPHHRKTFLLALAGSKRAKFFMLFQNINQCLFRPWIRKLEKLIKHAEKKSSSIW